MNAARSLRWMGQLIYKDFYVLRGTLLYMAALSLVMPLLTARLDQGWLFLGMWAGLVGYFYAISNSAFEDRGGGWTWMRILPVSPGLIMAAKYVANLLAAVASAALFTALGYLLAARGWLEPPAVPIYYYTFFPLPVVLCFGGIVMWLSVLWDYRRAQLAMYGFMMAILLMPGLLKQFRKPLWVEQWAAGTLSVQLNGAAWWLLAGLLGLYFVFGLMAARAFARRDL